MDRGSPHSAHGVPVPTAADREVVRLPDVTGDPSFQRAIREPGILVAERGEIMSETQEPIRQFFSYAHLPPHLAAVSEPFAVLADRIVSMLPRNPERTVALRKLLEAKDAAVRAALFV